MFLWNDELYEKACRALYRRAKRRGWLYNQPGRDSTEFTRKQIILKNCNGELGRFNLKTERLVADRS